ncbi:MAG: enoyl-CoA hydratase/isomerase family protein [Chloroflexi bacterium]|nr:enoyl-CoA hydratase/isomerase family protein [Chloroflexota bacterium]
METLIVDASAPFARITLNRPDVRNAMNLVMMDELIAAFESLEALLDVRAVVLRGADGHFCAGGDRADLRAAAEMPEDEQVARLSRMDTLLDRVNRCSKVVVAVIEGACLGGGFGLACVSDIAIAAEGAILGMPEVRIGLAPSLISPLRPATPRPDSRPPADADRGAFRCRGRPALRGGLRSVRGGSGRRRSGEPAERTAPVQPQRPGRLQEADLPFL